eukprot:COSAG05_NODE_2191_length_3420_cov_2.271906_2_plen_82_part_00
MSQILRAALLGFLPFPWMMWLNGVLGWVTGSKEHAVKQLLTGAAVDAGFGEFDPQITYTISARIHDSCHFDVFTIAEGVCA